MGTNPVYAAIRGGRVVAIAYETQEELGTDEDGEPVVVPSGWSWFPAEDPGHHRDLEIGRTVSNRGRGSPEPSHDAALDAGVGSDRRSS